MYLEIDYRKCYEISPENCFNSANPAAQFLAAALKEGGDVGVPIASVSAEDASGPGTSPSMTFVYIVIACGAILLFTLAVIIVISRRTERAVTWFPEGFFRRNEATKPRARNRKCPDGEEMQ